MTNRERWIVYPLLLMAIGLGAKPGIVGMEVGDLECRTLRVTGAALCKTVEVQNDVRCKQLMSSETITGNNIRAQNMVAAQSVTSTTLQGKKLHGESVIADRTLQSQSVMVGDPRSGMLQSAQGELLLIGAQGDTLHAGGNGMDVRSNKQVLVELGIRDGGGFVGVRDPKAQEFTTLLHAALLGETDKEVVESLRQELSPGRDPETPSPYQPTDEEDAETEPTPEEKPSPENAPETDGEKNDPPADNPQEES